MITTEQHRTFPDYLNDVQSLVDYHRELEDEKLLLALYYIPVNPERAQNDIFVFEVYDGFHSNEVSEYRDLQEVEYGSTDAFTLERGQRLHIVLTNPIEFMTALQQDWPLAKEVREAVRGGKYRAIYTAPSEEAFLEHLRA